MTKNFKILATFSPIFIGLLPVLSLFQKNTGEVWFSDFLFLSGILSFLILSVLMFLFLIKRNFLQASLSTILMFLPLSIVNESHFYHINLMVWAAGVLAGIVFLFIHIKPDIAKKMQQAIFIPLLALITFYGVSIGISKNRIATVENKLGRKLNKEFAVFKQNQRQITNLNSDIYFIILDEFISPIAFRNYYQYNNEEFFSFLESKSFRLARYSYSNYPWTIPSVSSMVSLNYHKNWVLKKEFPQVAHFLLRQNLTAKLLESDGYQVYSIPSIYWFGNTSKGLWKDFLFRAKSYGLTMSVLRSTPLTDKAREYQRIQHRNHIHHQFAQLEEIAKKKEGKKFVFTHFLCPHRPIVFDREGKELVGEDIALAEKDKNHKYYLNQAYFISQSIKKMIEKITTFSATPPIIVVVSDHGKFPIGVSGKGKRTLPLNELSWRLSNFIALYLPSSSIELPEILTPVNIFRLLLNNYYGYNLPLLEDICHTDFFDLEKAQSAASLVPFQYSSLETQAYAH